jgi:ribosomal-protein-alanine N-acetyltransferase
VLYEHYARDAEVARYMTWRPHRQLSETEEFLERGEAGWSSGSAFLWSLWLKSDGGLAGVIEARVDRHSVNLGYALCRRLWRQGLMSEALDFVARWSLAQPAIFRVWATCDVENLASARLLERAGMQREGILRRWIVHPNLDAEPRDCFCYALVK